MRIDILRQPLMATLLLFAVLATLFAYRFYTLPYPEELFADDGTPVTAFLFRFGERYRIIATAISLLIVFFNGVSVSRILSQHMVVPSRCYLPIVLYLIVSCGIWYGAAYLPVMGASLLMLRSIEYFISSFVRKASFDRTFRGALLMGCVPMIYPPAVIYLLAIPAAMAIFRRKRRETTVALIGGILPPLLYAYIMWTIDLGFTKPLIDIWNGAFARSYGFPLDTGSITGILRLISISLAGLLTLAGLVSFATISETMRTRGRTIFGFFIILLLIGIGQLYIPAADPAALVLLTIPIVAIIPMFFSRFPGTVSGTVYAAFLLSVAALNLYPLFFA